MAKRISLRISGGDWSKLRNLLFTADGHENSAVLLCGKSQEEGGDKLLVREIVSVASDQYIDRQPYHLEIAPGFYNSVVDRCLRDRLIPVICHSHPFDGPASYSSSDDFGEKRLLPVLESLLPGQKPASLLLTRTSVGGRILDHSRFSTLQDVTITGPRVQVLLLTASRKKREREQALFDRQIRAFGMEGQRTLESLTTAIVGLGGIGSLVAEQLVRAGIRKLILVDFDAVESSNLNRLFGATPASVGLPKVQVVADHLESIRQVGVESICDSVLKQSVLKRLRVADLVISCVDSDLARSTLTRFAYQYLTPLVDMGVRLDAREGRVTAAAGRVSVVGVDGACLRCSHHINPERVRAESLSPAEREALGREGYVMGIDEPAPAVVTLNCALAGLGATAAINLFLNLTGNFQPTSQLYDATAGIVFTATPVHEFGCDICDEQQGVKALGDLQVVSAYD
ncbi:MAG: ThiF family adenylyltransferase [Terriglobales bacterium]